MALACSMVAWIVLGHNFTYSLDKLDGQGCHKTAAGTSRGFADST